MFPRGKSGQGDDVLVHRPSTGHLSTSAASRSVFFARCRPVSADLVSRMREIALSPKYPEIERDEDIDARDHHSHGLHSDGGNPEPVMQNELQTTGYHRPNEIDKQKTRRGANQRQI